MLAIEPSVAPTELKRRTRPWTSDSFPCLISSSVNGLDPCTPRSSFMNSMRALSLFAVTMSALARKAPGPLPYAKLELAPYV